MNEFFARQIVVLRRLISSYREGTLGLNALVQRIEGIGNAKQRGQETKGSHLVI